MELEQTESVSPEANETSQPGFMHIEEKPTESAPQHPSTLAASSTQVAVLPREVRSPDAGTVEHLAARRVWPEVDTETPEMKRLLSDLRSEVTQLLTALRWEGKPVEEAADQLIPLLNVGPVEQWKGVLIPFLLEIDRAGNLIPTWLDIIERGEPKDLSTDMNPAETIEGRARRFAILMLGNYRTIVSAREKPMWVTTPGAAPDNAKREEVTHLLGQLAVDPASSLYATEALVKQGSALALQELIGVLKEAEGWAKVDIVEACLRVNMPDFNDLLIADGLDRIPGLENYVAIPLYQGIPLEPYFNAKDESEPRPALQAALIFSQVLQESTNVQLGENEPQPAVFGNSFAATARALFARARKTPAVEYVLAIHHLALLLGRYWGAISRGETQNAQIIEPVYQCLPMMQEVERWMAGPGRDVLLARLQADDDDTLTRPVIKTLGELHEPRAISPLLAHIEATRKLTDRQQALVISAICETLAQLGDQRAIAPLLQLSQRIVDSTGRGWQTKLKDNLSSGNPSIPGSIVYGAVIRATSQLGNAGLLGSILPAANDFDPYVRTQALEAIKRLDPGGQDARSRQVVREALSDPRDSIVRLACQMVGQYRDVDSITTLRQLRDTRPNVGLAAANALRFIGQ